MNRAKRAIRFTPTAWGKLMFLRDIGDSEIGCFGFAETEDPLLITNLFLPRQECTAVTVELDGGSLLEYVKTCRELGISNEHSLRVWIHTHPEMPATPSGVDERTFSELFDNSEWGIMLIVSQTGEEYARVRYGGNGPCVDAMVDIEIEYAEEFDGSDQEKWLEEYTKAVKIMKPVSTKPMQCSGVSRQLPQKYQNIPITTFDDYECTPCTDIYDCLDCGEQFEVRDSDITYRCPKCVSINTVHVDSYWG